MNPSSSIDEIELDIPGGTEGRPEAVTAAPRRLLIDNVMAAFSTFLPPLGLLTAIALHVSGWHRITRVDVILLVVMHFLVITGIEVGFHRLLAHASYRCHPSVKRGLAVLGSMAGFGPVLWWVYVHRRHHRYSDRVGDPHSLYLGGRSFPALAKGFVHAHIGWTWCAESVRPQNWRYYVRDLFQDPDLFRIHTRYFWILAAGLLTPGAIAWALSGTLDAAVGGVLWGGLIRMFVSGPLTYFSINSLSHIVGARPYQTADFSTNSIPWLFAIPTLGQSYHNNHHAFPSYWRAGHRWYEIDLGSYLLLLLRALGLVSRCIEPSPAALLRKRRQR